MTSVSTLDALRRALPADTERAPAAYALDAAVPALACSPGTPEDLAALLRAATAAGAAVTPLGARTATAMGRPLARHEVALETAALDRVVEYVPDDLTITVEAGMHLGALQQVLGEHGQYLPVDPPPHDGVSIGGLLATARPGAWRGHLPGARDLLLGARIALASGDLVRSGGRVVKNVTGYDLHRLHTGALGTLGVIVEASFKVAPLPAATRTLALRARSVAEAGALARRLWHAGLAARAITVLAPEAARAIDLAEVPTVLVDLAGVGAAVERSIALAAGVAPAVDEDPAAWARLRRRHGETAGTVIRLGLPPTAVADAIEAVRGAGAAAWGHVAAGAVIGQAARLDPPTVERLRRFAVERGGFLVVEAAPADLRAIIDWCAPAETALVRSLKARLDPRRTLNPGRWAEDV